MLCIQNGEYVSNLGDFQIKYLFMEILDIDTNEKSITDYKGADYKATLCMTKEDWHLNDQDREWELNCLSVKDKLQLFIVIVQIPGYIG